MTHQNALGYIESVTEHRVRYVFAVHIEAVVFTSCKSGNQCNQSIILCKEHMTHNVAVQDFESQNFKPTALMTIY